VPPFAYINSGKKAHQETTGKDAKKAKGSVVLMFAFANLFSNPPLFCPHHEGEKI